MRRRTCIILAFAVLACLSACSGSRESESTGIAVEFTASPVSGSLPLTVQFTDQSTAEGITAWSWSFGDGGASTQQNPSHTYSTAGSFDVTLAVTNAKGTETLTKTAFINVTDGGGGTDTFTFVPSEITVAPGERIDFVLEKGVSPYQVGYVDAADIESYSDLSQMEGQVNTETGVGYYVAGPNDNCTDRLAAMDANGEVCYLTITVSSSGGEPPPPPPGPGRLPGSPTAGEEAVFDMVNQERQNVGRSPLSWCEGLYNCAKAHSCDMCDRDFFSHVNPEGEGPSDRGRLGHAGSYTFQSIVPSPYAWIGENIAYGYTDPAAIMNMWMNSTGHRNNILNPDYTHIGVGHCTGCGRHWTQTFGTR